MPRQLVIFAILPLLTLGCAHGLRSTGRASEPGFVRLFNGKDLSGWTYGSDKDKAGKVKSDKVGEGYRVRGGAIYCTVSDGGNLFTEKEYSDFVFRFDFKLTPNANNGVGIRAPLEGNAAYLGMEIQVLDDTGDKYTALCPEQYHGSIYDVVAAKKGHLKPVGEWNREEITARGRHITVKLNGTKIVDADLNEIKDPQKLQKHPGLQKKSGHIGFLGHGADVEFRDIRIKELSN
jgi:hypothetical protein